MALRLGRMGVLAGFLFFVTRLPETKGKSLEELEKELVKDGQEQIMSTDF